MQMLLVAIEGRKEYEYTWCYPKLGELDYKKGFLPLLLVSTVSFEVVPLDMYTVIPACFPWFHASLEVLKFQCVDNLLRFCMDFISRVKTTH
jgi:hypothetical protein